MISTAHVLPLSFTCSQLHSTVFAFFPIIYRSGATHLGPIGDYCSYLIYINLHTQQLQWIITGLYFSALHENGLRPLGLHTIGQWSSKSYSDVLRSKCLRGWGLGTTDIEGHVLYLGGGGPRGAQKGWGGPLKMLKINPSNNIYIPLLNTSSQSSIVKLELTFCFTSNRK